MLRFNGLYWKIAAFSALTERDSERIIEFTFMTELIKKLGTKLFLKV